MQIELKTKLKQLQIDHTLTSPDFDVLLEACRKDISEASRHAANEATVVSAFELELYGLVRDVFSLKYLPEKEVAVGTVRHAAKGRIDSKLGALVIEFKHHSKLKTKQQREEASSQLGTYLQGLVVDNPDADYLGVVTDGIVCQIATYSEATFHASAYSPLSTKHLKQIVRAAILLDRVALTPTNLVKDFCEPAASSVETRLAVTLFDALRAHATGRSRMLFQEWKELFRLAHDDKSKQAAIESRRKSLEEKVGSPLATVDDEYLALYAIQTAYAIIVKSIAFKVTSRLRFGQNMIDFSALANAPSESLRDQMYRLEEGAIFRNLGIGNLLEGDFFAWYSTPDQWNAEIAELVRELFRTLSPYESQTLFDSPSNVRDLFKDLYLRVIPDKVRHSLGEFYTPPWLADYVVQRALSRSGNTGWRGLDPCVGSGTFVTTMIRRVLEDVEPLPREEQLRQVLHRVKALDLNPLAVLSARINYFINISHLVQNGDRFEIPVYLGDSSYVPESTAIGSVAAYQYRIGTLHGTIDVVLPQSVVSNATDFSAKMTEIEHDIRLKDSDAIASKLLNLAAQPDRTPEVRLRLQELADKFVELEQNDWNGIWARIVTNFLTTANLGRFDIIVGNPPWIDWKNLPAGYRERIKALCIARHLFSGDSVTGGINLNVCALIANVASQNWLAHDGILGLLMPDTILYQQSYEGFRQFYLDDGSRLYLQEATDWTASGHPFAPVTQKFFTYFWSAEPRDYRAGVPITRLRKKKKVSLTAYEHAPAFGDISDIFDVESAIAGQVSEDNTIFTISDSASELQQFSLIAGECAYLGREGIEFYPQELFLLEADLTISSPHGTVFVRNFQNQKSKYKIPKQTHILETRYLHPLIKGTDIGRFKISDSAFVVPFPYDAKTPRSPISLKDLSAASPLLAKYLLSFKTVIEAQTDYNQKIIGSKHANEFYALARVGAYSFAEHFVAFRDNTKWQAAVTSQRPTPWGDMQMPVFQNHAVSMSQDRTGRFISLDEAHYVCAILNAPIVGRFIGRSSDSRSFKIRPPVLLPLFDASNPLHRQLSALSRHAHAAADDVRVLAEVDAQLDETYLAVCRQVRGN